MQDTANMNMYGYVDIQRAKSQPYGTMQAYYYSKIGLLG
jgi:hypothetical protein